MKTVLLWGHQWWLPGHEPVAFATLAEAAAALAASWPDASRDIRLIYEPAGFSSVVTECPNGSRAMLALALCEQIPALAHPGLAWSHEPILNSTDHFQTILHHEAEPALTKLLDELAHEDFRVTAVYPLPTWLNALPEEVSESGGVCVAVLAPTEVCLYRHAPDGRRTVERWTGSAALEKFGQHLRGLLSDHPAEPILLVTATSAVLEPVSAIVPLEGRDAVHQLALADALLRGAVIPSRHPAQLLPPVRSLRLHRLMLVASVALLLTAAALAASSIRDHALARAHVTAREAQLASFRAVVAQRRANASEIEKLRRQTDQPISIEARTLLTAVAATLPRDFVLAEIDLLPGRIQAKGWMAPTATTIEPWLSDLRRRLPGWQLTSPPALGGRFELNGAKP